MSNLKLWDSVSKTDPAFTKPAQKGQFRFTSIAPVYQFKKATEAFGVQGIGWGVVVGSEVFQEKEYGTTIILSYDAVLFFKFDGERGEIPIHATEKVCYQTQGANGYMKIDDEVRKKVVTNAKTKGLSELGFNADVFMGMFEDNNYIEEQRNAQAIEKAADKDEEMARQAHSIYTDANKVIEQINESKTLNEVKGLYSAIVRRVGNGDPALIRMIEKAKDSAKERLTND